MRLIIGNKNYSSWSLRPWLLLDHFGLEFSEVQVSVRQENIRERLKVYSDACKVPVLEDKGLVVWDTLAICEYLSENYLDNQGWPECKKERAIARAISAEMHSGFFAVRNKLPMNCRRQVNVRMSETLKLEIDRIDQIWSSYAAEDSLGQIRLFGRFSIADCFFAPVVFRCTSYGVTLSTKADAYRKSMLEHPSMKKWLASAKLEDEIISEVESAVNPA